MSYALSFSLVDLVEKSLLIYERWLGINKEPILVPAIDILNQFYTAIVFQLSVVFDNEELFNPQLYKVLNRVLCDYAFLLKIDSPFSEELKDTVVNLVILLTQHVIENCAKFKEIKLLDLLPRVVGSLMISENPKEEKYQLFEKFLIQLNNTYEKEALNIYMQHLEDITYLLIECIETNECTYTKITLKQNDFPKLPKYIFKQIVFHWIQGIFLIVKNRTAFKEESYDFFVETLCTKIILRLFKAASRSTLPHKFPASSTMLKLFGYPLQQQAIPFIYRIKDDIKSLPLQKVYSICGLIYTVICFNGIHDVNYLALLQVLLSRILSTGHTNATIYSLKHYLKANANNSGILFDSILTAPFNELSTPKSRQCFLYLCIQISYYLHNINNIKEDNKMNMQKLFEELIKIYISSAHERSVKEYIMIFWYIH